MSYDLMVFKPYAAPRESAKSIDWYDEQTEWGEEHGYNDPQVASPALQDWFREMIESFPPLNGPLASPDVDDPRVTDHCIGRQVIYSAFAWPCAEEARATMRRLAIKHEVGFFDVSSSDREILFPGTSDATEAPARKWWKFW